MRLGEHAVFALGLAAAALSGTASASDRVPTVDDLARVQAETIVLKAKAKAEEARLDLAAKRAQGLQPGVVEDTTTLPVIKSILGTDRLIATFVYPGNVRVPAGIGDSLPGGYVVASIDGDTNKVVITRANGKDRYVIGFSTSAPIPRERPQPGVGQITMPTPFVPAPINTSR